ncbi:MAG: N-acetylmuramoyl-L-alanine amidase [Planctomycetota bacterium]
MIAAGPWVVVDPGHGDAPRGASSIGVRGPSGVHERDVVLEVAERVAAHLALDTVLPTRVAGENPSLRERADRARERAARVFVSLHAGGERPAPGPETWVHTAADEASRALAREVQARLATVPGAPTATTGAVFAGELAVLAPTLHVEETAACLVDLDALTLPEGEARLRDARHLDDLGRAIAGGILARLPATRRSA